MKYSCPYNPITCHDKTTGKCLVDHSQSSERVVGNRARPFDITNNRFHDSRPVSPPKPDALSKRSKIEAREYSVVSNAYFHDHEARASTEKEAEQKRLMKKFHNAYDYNHVKGTYFNGDRESKFRKQRQAQEAGHFMNSTKNSHISWKRNWSYTEDLITGNQKSDGRRPTDGMKYPHWYEGGTTIKSHQINTNLHKASLQDQRDQVARSIAKTNHLRFAPTLARGYDLITTKGYDREPPHLPHTIKTNILSRAMSKQLPTSQASSAHSAKPPSPCSKMPTTTTSSRQQTSPAHPFEKCRVSHKNSLPIRDTMSSEPKIHYATRHRTQVEKCLDEPYRQRTHNETCQTLRSLADIGGKMILASSSANIISRLPTKKREGSDRYGTGGWNRRF